MKLTKAQEAALLEAWHGPTGVVLVRGKDRERNTAPKVVIVRLVALGLLEWRKSNPVGSTWPAAKLTDEGYTVAAGLAREERRANAG